MPLSVGSQVLEEAAASLFTRWQVSQQQGRTGPSTVGVCPHPVSECPVGHGKPRGQARVTGGRAQLRVSAVAAVVYVMEVRVLPEMKAVVFLPVWGGHNQRIRHSARHTGPLGTTSPCDRRLHGGLSHLAHRLTGTPSPGGAHQENVVESAQI